jgi:hypothetical protein
VELRVAFTLLVYVLVSWIGIPDARAGVFERLFQSPRDCLAQALDTLLPGRSGASANKPSGMDIARSSEAAPLQAAPPSGPPLTPGSRDPLPDSAPRASLPREDYELGSRLLRAEESFFETVRRQEVDPDSIFMAVEGVPGSRLGLSRPELETLLLARARSHARMDSIAGSVPRAGLNERATVYLVFWNVINHAPERHKEVLRLAADALMQSEAADIQAYRSYLKSVHDEALALAVKSEDPVLRETAITGGPLPESLYEQALKARVVANGYPSPVHIEQILDQKGIATLLKNGVAFVDDIDEAVSVARAAGQVLPDRNVHGRLTHLVGLDYVGYYLRSKGVPPERFREALQWVGQKQDARAASSVWAYLFDQAPGPVGTRGISTPDVLHGQLNQAWGLTQ